MKKIKIFSPYPKNPIHPRLEMVSSFLREGYDVDVICPRPGHRFTRIVNWLTLNILDLQRVFSNLKAIKGCDLFYIQDLSFLPIAIFAKLAGKKVIYETLDDQVSLKFYLVSRELPSLSNLFFLASLMKSIEKIITFHFVDRICVNSKKLKEYFNGRAELIYYASPFEAIEKQQPENEPAFLYLGLFNDAKGALDIVQLQRTHGLPLYLFGDINFPSIESYILSNEAIFHDRRCCSRALCEKIEMLLKKHYLIGISLIKSVNQSYATQEANKDIDYLAIGIPIIGNHRKPTEEKILAGCGVFAEDYDGISRLLSESDTRKVFSEKCRKYYIQNYSQTIFKQKLLALVHDVANA